LFEIIPSRSLHRRPRAPLSISGTPVLERRKIVSKTTGGS
jgi:hypothetical protein